MIYYLYVFAIPLLIAFLGYFFEGKPSKSREWVNFLFKFIRELLTEIDIVEILEDEYDLYFQESSGDWFNTNCPLPGHEDSSPSFGANRLTGAFHCFGCGESGDLLAFIRKMEGLSFKQGLERLFMITGVDPEQENNDIYRTLRDLNSTVNDYINYIMTDLYSSSKDEVYKIVSNYHSNGIITDE